MDSDPATQWQASTSLHDPFHTSVSGRTQAEPLLVVSPDLSRRQVSAAFHELCVPLKLTTWQPKFRCQQEMLPWPLLVMALCAELEKICPEDFTSVRLVSY